MRKAVNILLLWINLPGPPTWEIRAQTIPEISAFQQYYNLSKEELSEGRAIRINASVLCYDAGWNQLYVHDGNLTVYFHPKSFRTQPQRGQRIEITGLATSLGGRPALTNLDLKVLGPATLPPAKRLELPQLGREFGSWIETSGRVRVADTSRGRLALTLHAQGQSCLAYVMGAPRTNDFQWLFGAEIRVRGINGSKIVGGRLESAQLTVPDFDEVTILTPSARDLSAVPVVSIGSVLNRELGSWTNDLVHINGVVSAYRPGEHLLVKDATGVIGAHVVQLTRARPDARVNVWGYLDVSPAGAVLQDAFFEAARPPPRQGEPVPATETDPPITAIPEVLTQVSDIRGLPRSLAVKGVPVRLEGVVTYADSEWRTTFLEDRSGGIYIAPGPQNVLPGQWVVVTGRAAPGGYAPQVIEPVFQVLGSTNMPVPARVGLEDLVYGNLDAQWVELQGVVRRLFDEWGHLYLTITTPRGIFKALIPGRQNSATPFHLIDALVAVQGACTSEMNARGQWAGVTLNVPSLSYVKVLEQPPADPYAVAPIPIASVATFHPDRLTGRRVKISGIVTLTMPGQGFYLQDGSGGIRVESPHRTPVSPGDLVDALGFPAVGDYSPYLEEATYRKMGSGPVPPSIRTTAERILSYGTNDAAVVTLEVQLLQRAPHSATPQLLVQDGPIIFTASLAHSARAGERLDLAAGCRLRLTGVCTIQGGENREPKAMRLLLASPDAITVLQKPPWWTIRHALFLVVGLTLALALGAVWIAVLRRTVEAQTRLIRRELDERNQFAESLARERSLLETLVDSLPDKVFVKDQDGRYLVVNRAFAEFHGLSSQEAVNGKTVFDFFPAEQARAYAENDHQVMQEGQSIFDRETLVPRTGKPPRWLSTTKVPLKDRSGKIVGLVGISRDITERRELESQLRHAHKLESVGQLAAGVAHDFNNLLTVILGRCDLLLRFGASTEFEADSLRGITSAAERGADLVRRLLMFSRKQPLRPMVLDVNALVTKLTKLLQSVLGENIQLEGAFEPNLPAVLADADMLEQVLINLAVNARDAMPSGGRLTIRTKALNIESDSLGRHPDSRPGRFVTLTVEDAGCGMDETTMQHLFEPFFTTKEVGKGTGLGLASVYGIVKQHRGWVEVASQPQSGSRFTVFLPASTEACIVTGGTGDIMDIPPGAETILAVEDEPALLSLVELYLNGCGYRVLTAASGNDALPVWQKHKSEIDLLLTDLVMPGGMTGLELAQRLNSEKPTLKIIFTSGHCADLIKQGVILDEGVNFLPKPYHPADLAKLVRRSLDRPGFAPITGHGNIDSDSGDRFGGVAVQRRDQASLGA